MRQMERDMAMDGPSPHIVNLGKLVEEHENKIRNTLNEIYFGKSRDIVNGLRNDYKSNDKFKFHCIYDRVSPRNNPLL